MLELILYCAAYYLFAALCISVVLHRTLSHRSLVLSQWFEQAVVTFALPAGTPVQWVGNHRFHHAHTDVPGDPHSPHLDGFWYAHVGWYIGSHSPSVCLLYSLAGPLRTLYDAYNRPRTNQQFNHLAADIAAVPYYRWASKPGPYGLLMVLHTVLFFGLAYIGWKWVGVGALWLTLVLIYNLGDFVDSAAHLIGDRPFAEQHQARNHWITGILAAGEWHANHHTFPYSARHGLFKGQFDLGWEIIRLLMWLGLASQVRVPEEAQIRTKLNRTIALHSD